MKLSRLIQISFIVIVIIGISVGSVAAAGRDGFLQSEDTEPEEQGMVGVIVGINKDAGTLDVEVLNRHYHD